MSRHLASPSSCNGSDRHSECASCVRDYSISPGSPPAMLRGKHTATPCIFSLHRIVINNSSRTVWKHVLLTQKKKKKSLFSIYSRLFLQIFFLINNDIILFINYLSVTFNDGEDKQNQVTLWGQMFLDTWKVTPMCGSYCSKHCTYFVTVLK